jgi:hypothetical protein
MYGHISVARFTMAVARLGVAPAVLLWPEMSLVVAVLEVVVPLELELEPLLLEDELLSLPLDDDDDDAADDDEDDDELLLLPDEADAVEQY